MAHPVLETEECIGCGICVDACPQDVFGDCRRRCRCRERRCMHRLRRLRREEPHGLHHRDRRRLIQILAASEGPVFKTSAGGFACFEPKGRFPGRRVISLGLRLWGGVCAMKAAWSCGIRSVPFLMLAQMALDFFCGILFEAPLALKVALFEATLSPKTLRRIFDEMKRSGANS